MNKIFSFILSFLLGGFVACVLREWGGKQMASSQRADFVFKGKAQEKLWFKTYNDTLLNSDNSVLKYKEGIISTPQCAAEVALALLDELYGHDMMKKEYPLKVTKDIKTWNINGTLHTDLGGTAFIEIYRPTGMVVTYTHFK